MDRLAALAAVFGIKGNMAMPAATCDLIACYGQILKRLSVSMDRQRWCIAAAKQITTFNEG